MADGDAARASTMLVLSSIHEVAAQIWNDLASPPGAPFNPFISHEFLAALERSKSVSPESGWAPSHILIESRGAVVAAAPLYVKSHSFGEYVFDQLWAQAYERAGGRYYPKVLCASPFTPVPGPRLLARSREHKALVAAAIIELTDHIGASSAHVNFNTDEDMSALAAQGFLPRAGIQYHWFNRGYDSFDDFLDALTSRKRKALKRERRDATVGLVIRRLVGREIDERVWSAFWTFYQNTGARKWGKPYLTRAFFREIAETMADRLMMIVAEDLGRPIAGALNFIGGDCLFGRYWGRTEDRPFLHFEVCYHQAIEFAIERGLSRVEAGAQGEHKIARGYEAVTTRSAHWIKNPAFRAAISRYLDEERPGVGANVVAIAQMAPFKAGN